MVQITNLRPSQSTDGKDFISFVLEGGMELIQSQKTGNFYAKGKKALLPTTLSEQAAKLMVGTQLPGSIQRIPCENYDYTIKETGEVITLSHTYTYSPVEESVSVTNGPVESQLPPVFEPSFNTEV